MVNLGCLAPASLASRVVVQIQVPINRIFLVLLGSLLGNWPKPSASIEGGFAFEWVAFHSVKERIINKMQKPPRITIKHSFMPILPFRLLGHIPLRPFQVLQIH
jgi:hypothetical protein